MDFRLSYLKMVLVLAKLRTGPRTTSMPLSSDAFSCGRKKNEWSHQRDNVFSSLKRCKTLLVYLQHHGVEFLLLVQLLGTGEDGGGFAGSGGAVEQEMGKLLLTDKPLD